MTDKILEKTLSRGSQDVSYREIFEYKGHKLRIRIKSDAYAFQSFAVIEILQPTFEWTSLHTIHNSNMNTPTKLCYCDNVSEKVQRFYVQRICRMAC